jgi:hypothetical protein
MYLLIEDGILPKQILHLCVQNLFLSLQMDNVINGRLQQVCLAGLPIFTGRKQLLEPSEAVAHVSAAALFGGHVGITALFITAR